MMIKFFSKNKHSGFTLIELLVVISVIGFLTTAAVTMLNSARVKTRNTKRTAEIVQLSKALQRVADDAGGVLPSSGPGGICCVSSSCTTLPAYAALDTQMAQYIKKPDDSTAFGRVQFGYGYTNPSVVDYGKGIGAYLLWPLEGRSVDHNTFCAPGVWYGPAVENGTQFCALRLY
ncbi:MAG: type II secretion system protein [Patescibacteria group bacterium]|nr:type II secretion system protein [Patescibacteria group bacterium]